MKTWGKKHDSNLQRDRIIALRAKDPDISAAVIATRLGCHRGTVDRVLAEHAAGERKARKKAQRDEEEFNRFVDQVTEDFL